VLLCLPVFSYAYLLFASWLPVYLVHMKFLIAYYLVIDIARNGPRRAVGSFYVGRGYVDSHTEHAAFPGAL